MTDVAQYPGLTSLISPEAVVTDIEPRRIGADMFLRVTEALDGGEGDQLLVLQRDGDAVLVSQDNVVEFPPTAPAFSTVDALRVAPVTYAGTMSDAQHASVARLARAKVDVFLTGDGPGHGSVACLWALRRLVEEATGIMITHQDGTGVFYRELIDGHMQPTAADEVPDGGMIVAPTIKGHVGHIGILGAGSGAQRLVYSNHSPGSSDPVARWKQNYTVGRFVAAHPATGAFFFRLPIPAGAVDLLAGLD